MNLDKAFRLDRDVKVFCSDRVQMNSLMKFLENHTRIRWNEGQRPTAFTPSEYGDPEITITLTTHKTMRFDRVAFNSNMVKAENVIGLEEYSGI